MSWATFWHLPSTPHYCWSSVIPTILQVGKQVVVARSEIRVVRRALKQLPVEMLQQCEQLYADAHCHGGALHRMSAFHALCSEWPYSVFLVFRNILLTLFGPLLHEFRHQHSFSCPGKQIPSAFWQADNLCLNFFGFFGECMCIRCFDCPLFSAFTNEIRFHHESSEIVKRRLSHILFSTSNKTITHFRWPTTSLFIVNLCSPAHLWTFYTIVLQLLHSSLVHFGRKPRIIHLDFRSIQVYSVEKGITAWILLLAGSSIARYIITL
jgi:hypothetical protein